MTLLSSFGIVTPFTNCARYGDTPLAIAARQRLDRAERVVRVLNVTAQRGDILHLFLRIPQQQGAVAHRA
ncbi:hypothetical protein F9U44_15295 [Pectobacterium versatile]|uniref:hypothetical protein n=1 Tax=Pectobacterium versatile TaxID=2488639 RepID=UPI001B39EC8A|nr:hypothetical protein [Pectobacterium versatile]MBQ4772872.1 hypothetical protein [Pectobacterium versatile]